MAGFVEVPPAFGTADLVVAMGTLFRVQAEMLIAAGFPREVYVRQLVAVASEPEIDPASAYLATALANLIATQPGSELGKA